MLRGPILVEQFVISSFVKAYRDANGTVQENPIVPPSIQAPLASSIFRQALNAGRPPPTGPALATEREFTSRTSAYSFN